MEIKKKRVGYIALIGRPNSGKSTFINNLIGEKVSIISEKPQTTQKVIKGIYNDDDSQMIFFDTPGINEGSDDFYLTLKNVVVNSIKNADVIVRFIDSSRPYGNEEEIIEEILKGSKIPVIAINSKTDISLEKGPIKSNVGDVKPKLSITSSNTETYKKLIKEIKKYLKEDFPLYPEDYYTDQDIYTRITEIIREKIFVHFMQEVPYSTFLEIEELEETPKLLKMQVYLYTETESQKLIIIGKAGSNLTKIGTEARLELEEIFGKKVFLSLRVKVLPKWKKNKKVLNRLFG
ncbi:MAG: GTPase Era [Candidatus Gracilibacteria bacterium]|nr:GTPase Era [Candidatus Gracilibacteria bacterium]